MCTPEGVHITYKTMKAITINLKLTKNIGNYQSVALGGEWSVDEGESVTDAMSNAKAQLEQAFCEMYTVQPAKAVPVVTEPQTQSEQAEVPVASEHEDKRELVEFGTPLLKRICARAQAGVDMATIEKYYRLSDEARKCVEIAVKIK